MLNKVRANQIVAKALQTRKKFLNASANVPICPYNLAESMGFDIRFVNIPSFEGMYLADDGVILISADRPEGRKRFTCAHEIGHHVLGHGTVIDEIIEKGSDKEIEKEADFFAGMLLMPSSAVMRVSKDLGIDFNSLEPQEAYILSKYFGLSFTAFLTQLYFNLRLISWVTYEKFKSIRLQNIKTTMSPIKTNGQIFVVGDWWRERAIDLEVGDFIITDNICDFEGPQILNQLDLLDLQMFEAISPGMSKLTNGDWGAYVRISRKNYSGMYQFRHEEEVE